MTAFEQIVIGKSSIPSLIVTAVLMAVIPAVFALYWCRKHKGQTKLRYLLAGAVGFLVSARMLELGVHALFLLVDHPVSRFINGSTAAYVVYGAVTAGVFEECGRYLVLKYILKKDRTRENAVLYGIGHGGIEILAVVLPLMITYLAAAILFSAGNTENALSTLKITGDNAAAALPSVQAAAEFDWARMALNVMERVLAMFVHIGLTVIVFYGIRSERKACLPAAILLHMTVDVFAALYQRGAVPLWSVEVWAALWAAVILRTAVRLYRKLKGQTTE